MNKQSAIFYSLLFLLCCSFTKQHNEEWKEISNKFYSITLPCHWSTKNEKDFRFYRLCSKTRIKSNKNQERFVIVQKSQEYDKTWNIYRVYYLLQQDDDMVHCVTIRMRENYAKKNPGKIEEIKRILDSFTIKGER